MSYVRTPAGTAAVLNPKIVMPRPVKALLLAINGNFDPYLYVSRLADANDVSAMLDQLLESGYVQAVHGTPRQTVGIAAPKPSPPTALPQSESNSRALQDAVAEMTGFVMEYLPEQALEISFALEGLSSAAQLEASLGIYEEKIVHLGAAADTHMARVMQILRQR